MNKSLEERIAGRYRISDTGCWEWTGAFGGTRLPKPQIRINWKLHYVSKVMWETYKGEVPAGKLVCHTCDNAACINVEHMFVGTQTENMRDASRKGRFEGKQVLNEEIVKKIKSLSAQGYMQKEISAVTGIPKGTIGHILTGRRWGNVEP